jgi:hypothetical protein
MRSMGLTLPRLAAEGDRRIQSRAENRTRKIGSPLKFAFQTITTSSLL